MLFLFMLFIFPNTEHFAESRRKIEVEIKDSVYGKGEGSCHKQIYTAPEMIDALGNPYPYSVQAVPMHGRFGKGKCDGVAA